MSSILGKIFISTLYLISLDKIFCLLLISIDGMAKKIQETEFFFITKSKFLDEIILIESIFLSILLRSSSMKKRTL